MILTKNLIKFFLVFFGFVFCFALGGYFGMFLKFFLIVLIGSFSRLTNLDSFMMTAMFAYFLLLLACLGFFIFFSKKPSVKKLLLIGLLLGLIGGGLLSFFSEFPF